MLPQQAPCYPAASAAGAPLVYGQPGFYSPPNQGLNVPVGIPAGVAPLYGSVASGSKVVPGAALVHVGNPIPGNTVVASTIMGNVPAQSLPANNSQRSFVHAQQSSFVQSSGSNSVYESPPNANLPGQWQGHPRRHCSPPPSSFPPGFEPRHNNIAMGIPSQPTPENSAPGGTVMHVNQHQLQLQQQQQHQHQHQHQHQRQQQHQSQLEFQHQEHFIAQPQHQQQQQHAQQPSHSRQHQHQHQHFQSQSAHPHQHQHQQHNSHQSQHQHQHQYQHHNQNQHQHQLQGHHNSQHQHQHPHQNQNQHQHHYQHQHQHQQQHPVHQQHQYEHQHYQHPHSQPQHYMQMQPQPFDQSNPYPQLQPHPQPQPQPHPACQQVQPIVQLHQPDLQTYTANGVAIGLPVMPTHSNVAMTSAHNIGHSQHSTPAWQQPSQLENSSMMPQLSKSSFSVTNNVQDSRSMMVASQGEIYPNGQQSTNLQRAGEPHIKDPPCEQAQEMSSSMPKSHSGLEGMKPADPSRIDHTQINRHTASGTTRPISFIESNNRNGLSPPRAHLRTGSSAANLTRASRDFQPHSNGQFRCQSNRPFPAYRDKIGDGQLVSHWQKPDFRGKPFNKGFGKRSDMQPLRCEPCDRTFTTSEILADHLKSHVKCGEEGCLFEAAGKVVKEHKVVEHGKVEFQSTSRGRKALALRTMEDKEDIKRWREERKRSYPSSGNILRKAEEKRKREAEGALVDEEAQQRRQRMMDIIAKQKQLGYQAPEIPSHYFRTQYNRQSKKSRVDNNVGPSMVQEEKANADVTNGKSGSKGDGEASNSIQDAVASSHDKANDVDNQHQRNGHFQKGRHNKFSSWQDRRKPHQNFQPRIAKWQQQSLLSKLLSKDIEAENSHLLQCCRFIVNNAFLQDCSLTSLKHFGWIGADVPANASDPPVIAIDATKLEAGEEASTSSGSKHSLCGDESHRLSDSKNLSRKEVNGIESARIRDATCCEIENAPDARKGDEDVDLAQSGVNLRSPSLTKVSGTSSNAESVVQMRIAHALVGSKETESSHPASKKPKGLSTKFSPQDLEAGEVASGNSESVVEDEEDIYQYMNLDVSGADSGCCYD